MGPCLSTLPPVPPFVFISTIPPPVFSISQLSISRIFLFSSCSPPFFHPGQARRQTQHGTCTWAMECYCWCRFLVVGYFYYVHLFFYLFFCCWDWKQNCQFTFALTSASPRATSSRLGLNISVKKLHHFLQLPLLWISLL